MKVGEIWESKRDDSKTIGAFEPDWTCVDCGGLKCKTRIILTTYIKLDTWECKHIHLHENKEPFKFTYLLRASGSHIYNTYHRISE